MLHSLVHRTALAALLATACLTGAGAWSFAEAAGTCTGDLATSSLYKLPAPLVVVLQNGIDNAPNPRLARNFVEGLQRAGISVADQGNATMNLALSIVPSASSPDAGTTILAGSYKGFDWATGDPSTTGPQGPAIRGAALSLSVTLTDNQAASLSWIATFKCKVLTDDSSLLASDIGQLIGRSIGQSNDRKRI